MSAFGQSGFGVDVPDLFAAANSKYKRYERILGRIWVVIFHDVINKEFLRKNFPFENSERIFAVVKIDLNLLAFLVASQPTLQIQRQNEKPIYARSA